MIRQSFLRRRLGLVFSLTAILTAPYFSVEAKPPTDPTYVVPSPEKSEEKKEETETSPRVSPEALGLDAGPKNSDSPPVSLYHLEPRPSITLALSRAYEVREEDHSGWLGVHVAPWMTPTLRFQAGIDIRDEMGWVQVALHSLPTRNKYRFYWGGGVSLIFSGDKKLTPIIDENAYHIFATAGSELQVFDEQNLRFELSYHQGKDSGLIKATLGYTFLL